MGAIRLESLNVLFIIKRGLNQVIPDEIDT